MRIIPATADHHAAILELNEEFVHVLAPLSKERLEMLLERASYQRVAIDGHEVAGFVLAFGSGDEHDSVNFRWFAARGRDFLYVDRVVVARDRQGDGVGRRLYEDLFSFARKQGYRRVTCEIDADPPNPASERFHEGFGFVEVGRQQVRYGDGRPKLVSLRATLVPLEEDGS